MDLSPRYSNQEILLMEYQPTQFYLYGILLFFEWTF